METPEIKEKQVWIFKENDTEVHAKLKILKVEKDTSKSPLSFGKKCLVQRRCVVGNQVQEDLKEITDFVLYSMYRLQPANENVLALF